VAKRTGEDDLTSLWPTLRAIRGWKQEDVAAAAGLWPSTVSDFEKGKASPQAQTRAKLAGGFGLPVAWLEPLALLLRVLRARMESPEIPKARAKEALASAEAWAAQAGKEVEEFLVPVLALLQADLEEAFQAAPRSEAPASPPGESLAGAALWERLEPYTCAQQRAAVQELEEFQSWPLCDFLCSASASMARDSADSAVDLADLACGIAERIPGDEKERSRRKGYAGCYLGNALRVQGKLLAAGETFDRALVELKAGASAASPQIDEVRLLDLEATLRRAQRRLDKSVQLLNQALTQLPRFAW
jgi:transcriptional regulator with XRE-family HTH domain